MFLVFKIATMYILVGVLFSLISLGMERHPLREDSGKPLYSYLAFIFFWPIFSTIAIIKFIIEISVIAYKMALYMVTSK